MQVLENLVANAVKYSRANTTITVEVSSLEDGKKIFFNVLDQGQGIPKEELKNLYREYGTTSVRPTAGEPSSGLGLAIVKQVVEAHQGEVHVESVVGVGSEFGFWIPCNTSVRF
jgi:signal transduction histidine kinase